MPYSGVGDLLLGDITVGSSVDKAAYVQAAADEMDGRLGYLYVLPFPTALKPHSTLVLKKINNFLASGRLIMAVAMGGEREHMQAYGLSLAQEAFNELALVLNGTLTIEADTNADQVVEKVPTAQENAPPLIYEEDISSGTSAFEREFYRNTPIGVQRIRLPVGMGIWQPGPHGYPDNGT